ncbi:MAG TPA: DUF5615 family PIN-like protein [Planctomycetaceae bacterium]|nr:DUF5615 family PIN-like protein [Planctomycetaceae bacterium]
MACNADANVSVSFYVDHNVSALIAKGLRRRGLDVLTAAEDGRSAMSDSQLLERATSLGRVFFTHDKDFLRIAADLQRQQTPFTGIIWVRQRSLSVRELIDQLEFFSQIAEPSDCRDTVRYLPL